jgi:hypothetical protein
MQSRFGRSEGAAGVPGGVPRGSESAAAALPQAPDMPLILHKNAWRAGDLLRRRLHLNVKSRAPLRARQASGFRRHAARAGFAGTGPRLAVARWRRTIMQTNTTHRGEDDRKQRNQQSLIRFGLMSAVAFFLASGSPPDVLPAALSSLLSLGAMVAAGLAAFTGDRIQADHFTRWDEAAGLMLLSLLAGTFVDDGALAGAAAGNGG